MNRNIHIHKDTEKDFKLLEKEAKKRNRSVNHMINLAIQEFVKNNINNKEDNEMTELAGKSILLKSGELKKTGEIGDYTHDWMVEQLEKWAESETNQTTHSDVDSFKKGNWFVEIYIREGGIAYTAGRTKQELNNQPEWAQDSWEDVGKAQFIEEFGEYL